MSFHFCFMSFHVPFIFLSSFDFLSFHISFIWFHFISLSLGTEHMLGILCAIGAWQLLLQCLAHTLQSFMCQFMHSHTKHWLHIWCYTHINVFTEPLIVIFYVETLFNKCFLSHHRNYTRIYRSSKHFTCLIFYVQWVLDNCCLSVLCQLMHNNTKHWLHAWCCT